MHEARQQVSSTAVDKVKLAGYDVDEQFSKIAEPSHEVAECKCAEARHEFEEAEHSKRVYDEAGVISLQERRAEQERRLKAKATEIAEAVKCEETKQQMQTFVEELQKTVAAALDGRSGTAGDVCAACTCIGPRRPGGSRRSRQSQQCDPMLAFSRSCECGDEAGATLAKCAPT